MKRVFLLCFSVTIFATQVVTAQETKSARYLLVVQGDLPLYPAVARTAHVSGSVEVRVTVKDGEVIGTEVTSGNPLLATSATSNIKTWKFNKTANATFKTTFTYQLEKEEMLEASNPKIELELPTSVKITATRTKPPCHDCGSDILAKPIGR